MDLHGRYFAKHNNNSIIVKCSISCLSSLCITREPLLTLYTNLWVQRIGSRSYQKQEVSLVPHLSAQDDASIRGLSCLPEHVEAVTGLFQFVIKAQTMTAIESREVESSSPGKTILFL